MGIINFSKTVKSKSYLAISLLGSSYKLNIKYVKSSSIDLVQNGSEFCLFLPAKYKNVDNMEIINSAIKKCSKKVLTVNPDIYQYNQEIIDTTILQAFCKMQYKQNSNAYKNALEFALNSYEKYKKQQRINIQNRNRWKQKIILGNWSICIINDSNTCNTSTKSNI